MESFDYLLELSMTLTEGQADQAALREAYEALVAIDAERGACATSIDDAGLRALLADQA